MKEVNDKKESMKPMSQPAVELDEPEITEICKLCGSTRNVRGGLCLACKNKC